MGQTPGQFLLVAGIIPKGRSVVVAVPKPAIVEDEAFDAKPFGFAGQGKQFGFGEIEIGSFPIVVDDGAEVILMEGGKDAHQ